MNEDIRDSSLQDGTELLKFEALVDSMNDAFGVIDNQGILTYANQKFCELLDYPLEDITGKHITSFLDDENLYILQNNIRKRTEGMSSVYELEWTARTGTKIQTIVSGTPLPTVNGDHKGSFAVITDISWRIAAEKKYKLLSEQSIQGLTIIQNDRYVYVNPAFAFIVGYTVDEILAMSSDEGWNLIHNDDKNYLLRLASDRRNGQPIPMPYEYRFVRRDGSIRWVHAFSSNIEFEGAKALQVLVIDVTEAKVAEEKLRASQEMLRTVMNTIPEYVFWKDLDSIYLGCNENFAMVSGVETPDNIIGKTDFDLAWRKVESELFRALDKEVIKTDRPQMHIISPQLQADGRKAWIEANIVPLHDDEEKVIGVIGTYQDITEKRLVEDTLRKSEAKYRSLAEQSVQGITIVTAEKFLYYNPAFRDLVGYTDEELLPMSAGAVWDLVHPEDREELRKRIEDKIAGR
ncbi:MAG: PAS domain-containing protein, partial [Candidatus Thorarchaeota archaeon]